MAMFNLLMVPAWCQSITSTKSIANPRSNPRSNPRTNPRSNPTCCVFVFVFDLIYAEFEFCTGAASFHIAIDTYKMNTAIYK